MKKLIPALLAALLTTSCALERLHEENLREEIIQAYDIPVRPGFEGKNPYWNKFA